MTRSHPEIIRRDTSLFQALLCHDHVGNWTRDVSVTYDSWHDQPERCAHECDDEVVVEENGEGEDLEEDPGTDGQGRLLAQSTLMLMLDEG